MLKQNEKRCKRMSMDANTWMEGGDTRFELGTGFLIDQRQIHTVINTVALF